MHWLSVLDPGGISRDTLTRLLLHDPGGRRRWWHRRRPRQALRSAAEVEDVVAALVAASLITRTVEGTAVVMHRLIGRVVRESGPPGVLDTVLTGLAPAVVGLLPAPGAPPPPEVVAEIAAQTVALLDHGAHPIRPTPTVVAITATATTIGLWLYQVGAYTPMVTISELVLAASERVLGPEHPDTLASRNNLAAGYRAVGRHQDAITLDEQTLTTRERVLGPDHPDTLQSRSNLANGYQAVGRHDDADRLDAPPS
ncbi:MAG: tetratricopeptide repeat protein [Kineosporiaceae bacterium]|nr:tetratricopeptide repeat protein [Kineosporiaceae bacterium]MBK7624696.1 tetratricopeptide repeat protein [Kineosporiaceae bacterium]